MLLFLLSSHFARRSAAAFSSALEFISVTSLPCLDFFISFLLSSEEFISRSLLDLFCAQRAVHVCG
eukprot:COSAG06_NODE_12932_length_1310_cov_634.968621_3_plen_66_part_00